MNIFKRFRQRSMSMLPTRLVTLCADWLGTGPDWLVSEWPDLELSIIADQWTRAVALDGGPPVIRDQWQGTFKLPVEDILNQLHELDPSLILLTVMLESTPDSEKAYLGNDSTLVRVYLDAVASHGAIEVITRDWDMHKLFSAWAGPLFTNEKPQGSVFTIISSMAGLQTHFLDFSGAELERGNYTDEVLKKYDAAVAQLNQDDPHGRLVILDGPTGSGKTHMVRGFLHDVQDSLFLVIPQGLVEQLVGPSMIPLLLDLRYGSSTSNNKPARVVFILEDADDALVPRDGGNINLISALLNFGDGILAQALNIRVIATTNQPTKKIDEAIMRPGRLLQHMSIDRLNAEHAARVLERLNPEAVLPRKEDGRQIGFDQLTSARYSLAEIYDAAHNQTESE